jgi:hypothetical protein
MFVDLWITRTLHPDILSFAVLIDPRVFQSKLKTIRPLASKHTVPIILDITQIFVRNEIQPLELVVGWMREAR